MHVLDYIIQVVCSIKQTFSQPFQNDFQNRTIQIPQLELFLWIIWFEKLSTALNELDKQLNSKSMINKNKKTKFYTRTYTKKETYHAKHSTDHPKQTMEIHM